jgi:hypothetical protein
MQPDRLTETKKKALKAEADRLIRENKMPTYEQLRKAVAEVRAKYRPVIKAVREKRIQ